MALSTTQAAAAIAKVLHDVGVAGDLQVISATQASNVVTLKVAEPTLGSNPGQIKATTRTFTVTIT